FGAEYGGIQLTGLAFGMEGLGYACANWVTCLQMGAPMTMSGPQIAQQVLSAAAPQGSVQGGASGGGGGWGSFAYAQNVAYSQATGKASNTNTGSTGGGGGSYTSQTYKTPSGAIVDWNGNVVVAAPKQSGSSSSTQKQ